MREILLLESIYGPYWQDLITYFRDEIGKLFRNLDLEIDMITLTESGNIYIRFSGKDEEFAYNLLKKEFHVCKKLSEFEVDSEVFGKLIQVGKYGFGIFVNVGALYNDTFTDALIALHKLREQLVNDKKISTRKIIDIYGLVNNMPVQTRITEVNINEYKIEACFSESQLQVFNKWINEGSEIINICGVLESKIKKVLKITNHKRDIKNIVKLGLFEYSLVCKPGTEAPGIISHIGSRLPGVEMNAFVPERLDII
ncbi:MAG: DUF2110 family protein [Candidatus Lokiarchaeota archaeon]|nr:DUF2110 family protein [Candidatus Lokiarchaeota archaeon]